jgi:mannose-6-phosphate isomerase-like protein (cupin superfamily)
MTKENRLPIRVTFPKKGEKYQRLLEGPPQTAGMHSGYVVLVPGTAVGEHSTGSNEEMLVPLSGKGELRIPGMEAFPVTPGCVLYSPPQTLHNVVNTYSEPLVYIYIVTDVLV